MRTPMREWSVPSRVVQHIDDAVLLTSHFVISCCLRHATSSVGPTCVSTAVFYIYCCIFSHYYTQLSSLNMYTQCGVDVDAKSAVQRKQFTPHHSPSVLSSWRRHRNDIEWRHAIDGVTCRRPAHSHRGGWSANGSDQRPFKESGRDDSRGLSAPKKAADWESEICILKICRRKSNLLYYL